MAKLGQQSYTDAQLADAVAAYQTHGEKRAAAKALHVSESTMHRRLQRAAEKGLLGYKPVLPGFVIKQVSTSIDKDGETYAEHIQQVRDGDEFDLPQGHVVKGISALVDPDGHIKQQWIKTKLDTVLPDLIAAIQASFAEYTGKAELIAPPESVNEDLLSVYPIADQHNGLLAWGQESGESYDLKIGAARLRSTMAGVVSQAPPSTQGLILNLGDWQHNDDQKNMTPRSGNLLDVDGRYPKVLRYSFELLRDCIDLALQRHQQVIVKNIPGNHDPHASIALTLALSAFYEKNERVTIDDKPGDFFFHRFGKTLIGAAHGHKCKPDRMAMTMAVRCREDWGQTDFHYFYYGHIHQEVAREVGDVRCESFQTLAAKDSFAAGAGYNSGQSLCSITIHKINGEIGRHRINIAPKVHRATTAKR